MASTAIYKVSYLKYGEARTLNIIAFTAKQARTFFSNQYKYRIISVKRSSRRYPTNY